MASHSKGKPRFLTYRVQNLPHGVTKDQLRKFFYAEDQDDIKVKSLCPAVDTPEGGEGDYTATIFFRPHGDPQRPPRVALDTIDIDKDFIGFTTLYVPHKERGPIAADIIAISGLAGHAYGSWAHSPEHMWIRDYLPKDAPNARILTYGYPSTLQGNTSVSTIQDHTATFVQNLIGMRESGECESRPIIFIAHSLGCVIIKKALADIALMGVTSSRLPVRAIIFLGGPHRGLNVTAMQTLVKGHATQPLIDELAEHSRTLNEINQRFARLAGEIEILTCYETKPTKTLVEVDGEWIRDGEPVLMVALQSAQLYLPKEKVTAADTDHSQIAKIKKGEGGIYPTVKSTIRQGLVSTARIVASVETQSEPHNKFTLFHFNDAVPPYTPSAYDPLPTDGLETGDGQTPAGLDDLMSELHLHEVGAADIESEFEDEASSDEEDEGYNELAVCDVCDHLCRRKEVVYRCLKCYAEDEDDEYDYCICEKCYKNGARCLEDNNDGNHVLGGLVLRGTEYLCYPDRTVQPSDAEIIKAIKTGDAVALRTRTRNRRILNTHTEEGTTPLILAIQLGLENMVTCLLDVGAFTETKDDDGVTPLINAIKYIRPSIVSTLLEHGADSNAEDGNGLNPLGLAISLGNATIVDMLLSYGADVDGLGTGDRPPLHEAIFWDNLEILELILTRNPVLDVVHDGKSALLAAYDEDDVDAVRLLLEAGADANFGYLQPETSPLLQAALRARTDFVQLLLEHGAQLELVDQNYYTVLLSATRIGAFEACRILLDAGSHPDCYDSAGITPLMSAVLLHRKDIAQLLLQRNADVNWKCKLNWTALSHAAQSGDFDMVHLLVVSGAYGPPYPYAKWKHFPFNPNVPKYTQNMILDTVRRVKYSPVV